MSVPPDIMESWIESGEKAANGSDIIHRVGNDPEGSFIDTLSGPTPSIKEWLRQKSDQIEQEFNAFLSGTQYEVAIPYATGLSITRATQTVLVSGIVYRPVAQAIPFVTTTFPAESAKWAVLGDASLRQDLLNGADPTKNSKMVTYGGARSTVYIPSVGDALDGAMIDASRFGVKGNGTNEGARIEAAIASGENIQFQRHMVMYTDRPLATASERQLLSFDFATLRPFDDLGSNYILTLLMNFSEIRDLLLINDALLNSKGIIHKGFRSALINPYITGTTLGHVVTHDANESILAGGKVKGGTGSGVFINKPDSNVQFVYLEENMENGFQAVTGGISANNVHSFKNGKNAFRLTGTDFSQFSQLYGDTNGENGLYLDQTKNCEFYSAWMFKSNQSLGSQKFELLMTDSCNSNTFYGFRAGHGSDAAKTDRAMDIGMGFNTFHSAYSQSQTILRRVDAGADITNSMFTESRGMLTRYNKDPHSDKKHLALAAASSGNFSFVINRALSTLSNDVFVFELFVVGRDAASSGVLVMDLVYVPVAQGTSGVALIKQHIGGSDIFTYALSGTPTDNSVVVTVTSSSAAAVQVSGVLSPKTSARSLT